MRNLSTVTFEELCPEPLIDDLQVQALAAAVNISLHALPALMRSAAIITDIANQPSSVLDALARAWHVDGYQQTFTLTQKRALVLNSLQVHRSMGTPAAVQAVILAICGPGMTLQEWWEYGGAPYHFRVFTPSAFDDADKRAQLLTAIAAVKNLRSVLDPIVISQDIDGTVYAGSAMHTRARYTI